MTIKYREMYQKTLLNFAAWLPFKTGQALRSAVMKISNSSNDNFVKKSLLLSTKIKKTQHSFELFLPICLF